MKAFHSFRPGSLILLLCLISAFLFCSKSDDGSPTGPGDDEPFIPGEVTGTVDSNLQNALDFGQLSLLVPNSEADIGSDGSFSANFLVLSFSFGFVT